MKKIRITEGAKRLYGRKLMSILGPYVQPKNKRLNVVLYFSNGKRKTISYPKFVMEIHLERLIIEPETIDHIDCDFYNNDVSNLVIVSRSDNVKKQREIEKNGR